MEIINKSLDQIMPYERNPRNNDSAVDKVAASIEEFGFKVPIIIDAAGVIVTGHTRYKAAKKLGLESVPCIMADDLTPYQIAAFRIADNKVAEFSDWDFSLLDQELEELDGKLDMSEFGFDLDPELNLDSESGIDSDGKDDTYTDTINIPQYEITGECPELEQLLDTEKADSLIEEIQQSNISEEQKEFLIQAARRHNVFNYRNIAEYYAHQSAEMQELMEKSALVIIDYNDAIAYGYTTLKNRLEAIRKDDIGV